MAKKKGGGGGRSGAGPSRPLVIEFGPRAAAAIDRVRDATAKTAGTVSDIRNRSTEGLSAAATTARDRVLAGGAYGGGSAADRAALTRAATEAATAAAAQALRDQQRTARAEMAGFGLAQSRAYRFAGTASQLGFGGIGRHAVGVATFGAGLEAAGFARAGAAVSKAAPAAGVAAAGVETAGKLATIANDRYATREQQLSSLTSLDPTGALDWLKAQYRALNGRTAAFEQEREIGQAARYDVSGESRARQMEAARAPTLTGIDERAKLFREGKAVGYTAEATRASGEGERQYQEQRRLLPLKKDLARAEREQAVAAKEHTAAQAQLGKAVTEVEAATRERARLYKELEEPGRQSGKEREATLQWLGVANQRFQEAQQTRQQAAEGVYQSGQRLAAATGARGQSRAALLQGEAEALYTRADTAGDRAKSLARMDPGERAMTMAFAQAAKRLTPEQLAFAPQEFKTAYETVSPEDAAKAFEKAGAGTREFKQAQREGFTGYGSAGSTPQGLRDEGLQKEKEAQEAGYQAESQASQLASAARQIGTERGNADAKEIVELLKESMKAYTDALKLQIKIDAMQARNQQ